jgi:hypothetical protein
MYINVSEKETISSILTDKAYLIYVHGLHPVMPSDTDIENSIKKLSTEELKLIVPIASMVEQYARAVEQNALRFLEQHG